MTNIPSGQRGDAEVNKSRHDLSALIMLSKQIFPAKKALGVVQKSDSWGIPLIPNWNVNPVLLLDAQRDEGWRERKSQKQPAR